MHAQDRFWEMDVRRHVTAGRAAEMLGEPAASTDAFLRTLGWRRVAEQELPLLSAETRAALDSYAQGVNAYLKDKSPRELSFEYVILGLTNSGYEVEPWTPADSVAWLKAMSWDLRGNMQEEIQRSLISAEVGVDRTESLYPDFPFADHEPIVTQGAVVGGAFDQDAEPVAQPTPAPPIAAMPALRRVLQALDAVPPMIGPSGSGIGSNSWVVSGDRTSTGEPLLANDPHLGASLPGIWYQMGLHCAPVSAACPYDVAGYTFSGHPGVVIGHNADVAWGFTNLGPDVSDLYLEKVEGDTYRVGAEDKPLTSRREVIKVAGGEDLTITVRSTEHGPLLSDVADLDEDFERYGQVGVGRAGTGAVARPRRRLRGRAAVDRARPGPHRRRGAAAQPGGGLGGLPGGRPAVRVPLAEHDLRRHQGHDRLPGPGPDPGARHRRRPLAGARLGPRVHLGVVHPVRGAAQRHRPRRRLHRDRQRRGDRHPHVPVLPHR